MAATATKTKAKSKKAKVNTIHIALLLDESGSMGTNVQSVIDGTNEFVGTLRGEKNSDKTRVAVAMFDDRPGAPMCRIRKPVKLDDFTPLKPGDYQPQGMTPLYDSVAETIATIEREMTKGDKAMLVVFTDGYENASREHDAESIRKLIEAKEKGDWTVIYLGANVVAEEVGQEMGLLQQGSSYNYTSSPQGTTSALRRAGGMSAAYMSDGGTLTAASRTKFDSMGDIAEDEASEVVGDHQAAASTPKPTADPNAAKRSKHASTSADTARNVLRG